MDISYPISARVSGQIATVNYDDGQVVRKGDVLAQIDPTDYQVALDPAKAEYQDALSQAQATQYEVPVQSVGSVSQIRSASADMVSPQAGVAAAQKQVEAAQQEATEAQANAVKVEPRR
ncbi:MAG TPA: biotin/lipoyl-binding protein [Terracidiphilus sp.]